MSDEIVERNNVQIRGRGERPLILAHGFGCDQTIWSRLVPWFEDDYRVVLFDYVGSGRSDPGAYDSRRYGRLDGYAQDVLDICRALELEEAVFVGHSISSMIGLRAAIREPERFDSLVLVAASPSYANIQPEFVGGFDRPDIEALLEMMERNFVNWARMLAPQVMANPEQPELASELENAFTANDPVRALQFARLAFLSDNRELLSQVSRPSLIVHCTDDALARPEVGDYLHAHLADSDLRMVEASGHFPHVSAPRMTAEVIRDYLDVRAGT